MHAPKRALAASALMIALVLTGCSAASEPAASAATSSSPTESGAGELAERIISDQSSEIAEMEALLDEL